MASCWPPQNIISVAEDQHCPSTLNKTFPLKSLFKVEGKVDEAKHRTVLIINLLLEALEDQRPGRKLVFRRSRSVKMQPEKQWEQHINV